MPPARGMPDSRSSMPIERYAGRAIRVTVSEWQMFALNSLETQNDQQKHDLLVVRP